MWELDCEEGWAQNNWCFWTVVLEKPLESPLDCKEIQPVHSEGDPRCFQKYPYLDLTDILSLTCPKQFCPKTALFLVFYIIVKDKFNLAVSRAKSLGGITFDCLSHCILTVTKLFCLYFQNKFRIWPFLPSVLWPHGLQPTRLLGPWDFPGNSTGVGCHCLRIFPRYPCGSLSFLI